MTPTSLVPAMVTFFVPCQPIASTVLWGAASIDGCLCVRCVPIRGATCCNKAAARQGWLKGWMRAACATNQAPSAAAALQLEAGTVPRSTEALARFRSIRDGSNFNLRSPVWMARESHSGVKASMAKMWWQRFFARDCPVEFTIEPIFVDAIIRVRSTYRNNDRRALSKNGQMRDGFGVVLLVLQRSTSTATAGTCGLSVKTGVTLVRSESSSKRASDNPRRICHNP